MTSHHSENLVWHPDQETINHANITECMQELHFTDYPTFHRWSVDHFDAFWQYVIRKLNIIFKKAPEKTCDLDAGIENPRWFPGSRINIIESCFNAPTTDTALIFQHNGQIKKLSFGELDAFSNQIANGLVKFGFKPGDAIAIIMPMTEKAIAIYLGIIKMGGTVVSIADSFSASEIKTRLHIAKCKTVFTEEYIVRGNKQIPLKDKIIQTGAEHIFVVGDSRWQELLDSSQHFIANSCAPMTHCNILFSSGTTGDPKAIPWNHTTAIKAASDAFFHQDIHPGDVLCWPTNLGWMMGPWLIFAAFINQAAIAVYDDVPKERTFGEFVQNTRVTMLGVVPTLVSHWRQSRCMEGLNWHSIKCFSSTGECSNADDMAYLMALASNKPIIEYCGGTEIGGAYLTSTVIQNNYPAQFSTPALGLDFLLLDENGNPAETGEVALLPPSIGLSTELLNADHHKIYYANMPRSPDGRILRRHGDQAERLANGYYSILGRIDDTMNLGGIKISSAEIERALQGIDHITETAAIAVAPKQGGPHQLVIFAVTQMDLNVETVKKIMQGKINQQLNPLFKIHDVKFVTELPRTASNKVMRRILRKNC